MINRILFTGDFFVDDDEIPEDLDIIGKWVKKNGFLSILNLEGPIIASDEKKGIIKRGPNLACTHETIDALKELNAIGVSLANNHMLDFGKEGLDCTIMSLDNASIMHSGAGMNLAEAIAPFVVTINGYRVAILSFGWDVEERRVCST